MYNLTKNITFNFIAIIFIVALSVNAYSKELSDKTQRALPQEIQVKLKNPILVGSATLNILIFDFYDIDLWAQTDQLDYNRIFAISIKYKKNFSKESLVSQSIKEMRKNSPVSAEQELRYKKDLNSVFMEIKPGDVKSAIFIPNSHLELYHNHEFIGNITDQRLARLFVDIWLNEESSFPKLTAKLIGKNE